jgi:hypothetical protein
MVADVYAGDDDLRHERSDASAACAFLFIVEAVPDPDAWARVANQFMLANLLPVSATMTCRDNATVVMAVELRGVVAEVASAIERKLSQLTCVLQVTLQTVTLTTRPARHTKRELS